MTQALGIIDAQRGFMPADEGARLHRNGFGELPITDGEQVVAPLNRLMATYALRGMDVFTTQDWHPHETAHFSDEPNFSTTWPRHCVMGTPGAELHPELEVPAQHVRFTKGSVHLERGEDDTSYSGYHGINTAGHTLGEWLYQRGVRAVALGGLALDYCVGATAIDLRERLGLDVTVVSDATRAVAPESAATMLERFDELGIHVVTTDELLQKIRVADDMIAI